MNEAQLSFSQLLVFYVLLSVLKIAPRFRLLLIEYYFTDLLKLDDLCLFYLVQLVAILFRQVANFTTQHKWTFVNCLSG